MNNRFSKGKLGLDQYAATRSTPPETLVDFDCEGDDLFYWRKHPNLHGWMTNLYIQKGGQKSEFNCTPVVLDLWDLAELEATVRDKRLPATKGFFFGESNGSEIEDDLDFISRARAEIATGKTVYYYAWW